MRPKKSLFYPILISCFFFLTAAFSQVPNAWDVVRGQLSLDHALAEPDVQAQIRWLISHPNYLQQLSRAEPYLYHIITEIKKRHLPGELALIPMIESSYDPFAYSWAGAVGLWQIMPGTADDLGLKKDWWFDGRRSIEPSTDAALNYLRYLNNFFSGDWLLAIAAYDAGAGRISRAIKSNSKTKACFWDLSVPSETKAYVPRLLALAEIIKYPQRYKISLPHIPHTPYFKEVYLGGQIDLGYAAKLAGISYHDLLKLNPGYNRWATAPYKPSNLLIPANKVSQFYRNLSYLPRFKQAQTRNSLAPRFSANRPQAIKQRLGWLHYKVQPGDSLESIAQRYLTNIKQIALLNQLSSSRLRVGQWLFIPGPGKHQPKMRALPLKMPLPRGQFYKVIHIVQERESMKSLEGRYGVSAKKIRLWNHLAENKVLQKGDELIIWRYKLNFPPYKVLPGDTLTKIAKRHGIQADSLKRLNPGLNLESLQPGQQLRVQ